MADTIFADGMYFENPHPKAPPYIRGKISVKVDTFIPFLEKHRNVGGYVNLDVKESKNGKLYVSLNDYKKGTLRDPSRDPIAEKYPPINWEEKPSEETIEDIPF